jgi:hypothetical protein
VLSPLTSAAKVLAPIAYDLEWEPKTLILRLCGVYDERGYREYHSIQAFLEAELTDDNRGRTFFAHAGGKYDVQEPLKVLKDLGCYHVDAHFSGASAVIVKVKRGRNKWLFCDSFFLLRDSLKKVGETIGLEKMECSFTAPIAELRIYNERDCQIVHAGLHELQRELLSLGGEMRSTLASSAMSLFRRVYLRRGIPTSRKMNAVIRRAYCASRVEAILPYLERGQYYDINSSFPFSMTFPQPGEFLGIRDDIPKEKDAIYFAACEVTVPDMYLPPLPYKRQGRIFFPTGTWRGWFSRIDLELLLCCGGRIDRVWRVLTFAPFTDLSDYVKDIYERRKQAKQESKKNLLARASGQESPFPGAEVRDYTYKLLLNSLYGKFAEREEKDTMLINPESTACPHREGRRLLHSKNECMRLLVPGIYLLDDVRPVYHAHVPISAWVTSLSRRWLYDYMAGCKTIAYCDTDSVVSGEHDSLPVGDELGQLKYEGAIRDARFLAAKLYSFTPIGDTWKDPGVPMVKAKGFSRITAEQFGMLERYQSVPIERMAGIRERLRQDGELGRAWSAVTSKRIRPDATPKRAPDGQDNTRPWRVEELEKGKKA